VKNDSFDPKTGRAYDVRFDITHPCGCVEFYAGGHVPCSDESHWAAGPPLVVDASPAPAEKLAYVGRIVQVAPVPNADRLDRAQVDCLAGGLWWGVVGRGQFALGDSCVVYLQDAILPQTPEFEFMKKYKYRVRMQKLRGVPSEVLIMPDDSKLIVGGQPFALPAGADLTEALGVRKFEKPVAGAKLGARRKSYFPPFLPKTDEPNFQRARRLLDVLRGERVYITVKCDGSSATFYRKDGVFGVCSRNLELFPEAGNAFWDTARRYKLDELLDEGFALQAELVGPGVQGNPMGLTQLELRVFNVYKIGYGYLDFKFAQAMAADLYVPFVHVLAADTTITDLDDDLLRKLAEGWYQNGSPHEGIVIRPMREMTHEGERVSVKVINLLYKESE
jgi:RNA ligase (TIGR02306 family)